MRKIKIFKATSLDSLEDKINVWLKENQSLKVLSGEVTDYNSFTCYAVLWVGER